MPPAVAVIVAMPSATAVTVPFSTVATASLLESHETVLSVALSGVTVAVSVSVSPTMSVALVLSKVTSSTATVVSPSPPPSVVVSESQATAATPSAKISIAPTSAVQNLFNFIAYTPMHKNFSFIQFYSVSGIE